MTVEITSYTVVNGIAKIYAIDCSEERLQMIERNRYDDGDVRELTFIFDPSNDKKAFDYLYFWLKKQKATRLAKTIGEALTATIGTVTSISGRYLERYWKVSLFKYK